MTCYLQLEMGGHLQKNSGDGFLLLNVCNDDVQASNWKMWPDHDVARRNAEYRAKQEEGKRQEAEESIIRLRLEAQETLLQRKEADTARRQKALDKQYAKLMAEIKHQMLLIQEAEQMLLQFQNDQAIIILTLSYPFLNIGGLMH